MSRDSNLDILKWSCNLLSVRQGSHIGHDVAKDVSFEVLTTDLIRSQAISCRKKTATKQVFPLMLLFLSVMIIPPMLHTCISFTYVT